jgi:hypothetical protein
MSDPFFTEDEILELTQLDESAMPDTIVFQPGNVAVACRFGARGGDTVTNEAVIAEIGRYVAYVPKDTDVPRDGTAHIFGRTYRIVYTPPADGYATSREVGLNGDA